MSIACKSLQATDMHVRGNFTDAFLQTYVADAEDRRHEVI